MEWILITEENRMFIPTYQDFLILFENGDVRRYKERWDTKILITHYCLFPELPKPPTE